MNEHKESGVMMGNNKKGLLIAIIGLLVGFLFYFVYFKGVATEKCELLNLADGADNVVTLTEEQTFYQRLKVNYDFDEIVVDVEKYADTGSIDIIVQDAESGDIEEHYCLLNEDLEGNGLRIPLEGKRDQNYILILSCIEMSAEDSLVIYTAPNYSEYGTLYVNENANKNNLCMHVIKHTLLGKTITYFSVLLVLIMSLLLVYYMLIIRDYRIERVFLVGAVCLGMLYSLLFPPTTVADEEIHFFTSYLYSNVLLSGEAVDENVMVRESDKKCVDDLCMPSSYLYYTQMLHENEMYVGKQEMVQSNYSRTRVASNGNMIIYLPCIMGIVVSRLLGLGIVPLMLLSKILNLLSYIFLSYWGIKRVPFGKYMFSFIALLPMALAEAGSLSYDSMTMGITFAFLGNALYLIYSKENVGKKDVVLVWLLGFLLGFSKGGLYLLVAGVLVMVFSSLRDAFRKKNIWVWITWILGVMGYFIAQTASRCITDFGGTIKRVVTESQSIQPANEALQIMTITQCLQNPHEVFKIVWMTIVEKSDEWILSLAGKDMFWYDNGVPTIFSMILIILLVYTFAIDSGSKDFTVDKWHAWCMLLVFTSVILGSIFIMIIADGIYEGITPGVQGRYFLPVLPLLLIFGGGMNESNKLKLKGNIINVYAIFCIGILYMLLAVLCR